MKEPNKNFPLDGFDALDEDDLDSEADAAWRAEMNIQFRLRLWREGKWLPPMQNPADEDGTTDAILGDTNVNTANFDELTTDEMTEEPHA